jgi:hypothetical protein
MEQKDLNNLYPEQKRRTRKTGAKESMISEETITIKNMPNTLHQNNRISGIGKIPPITDSRV